MKNHIHTYIHTYILLVALAWAPAYTKKQPTDYNGNIFTKQGIILTPSSIYYGGPLQAATSPQLAGYLDLTFNATGSVVVPTFGGGASDKCTALQLQPDGKLVLAGYSTITGGALCYTAVRLNSDGSVDNSFGTNGTVVIPTFGGGNRDQCNALQLQPDGKLVLAGYSKTSLVANRYRYSVVRLNSNGSVDSSFGPNGNGTFVVPTLGNNDDECYALQLQSDGKIVLAGFSFVNPNYRYSAVRLNTDGSVDTSFGPNSNGTFVVPRFGGGGNDQCHALAIQDDGKLVLAGQSDTALGETCCSAVRLNTNGSVDNSFGANGYFILPALGGFNQDFCYALKIQADGKLILAGFSRIINRSYLAVRLTVNGILDNSFGPNKNGIVIVPNLGVNQDYCYALQLQLDGKLILAGWSRNPANTSNCYSAVRLNTDGSLDTSFGTNSNGSVIVPTFGGNNDDECYALQIQLDGKLVLAGWSDTGAATCYSAVRLTNQTPTLQEYETLYPGQGGFY